ncbi:2OG-Fe(II) oxygenase [Thiohalomonas denitrificans]|uniref:SM-20-related protein n=1 Tax=Thiohalomonas denitrificans TaxID=415747 RepID=A0A1G5QIP6_9GAMM|nr:2OG-Fe(II) oxygenase [Thiohalomonas denitrificans]SCZ61617.1 SM-20-related protein [Thiohalomonas denitrificans]
MDLEPCQAVVDALADRGWGTFPGFVEREEVRELARECRTQWDAGGFRHAGVGRGEVLHVNADVRTDHIMWLDPEFATPAQLRWHGRLEKLRLAINRDLYLGLADYEGHFAIYPPGSFYRRHRDQFRENELRTITTILYLNEDWRLDDGGQLRLYLQSGEESPYVDILPEAGTLVSFLSGTFLHEVLPAGRQRMSLTGWYRKRI